MAEPRPAHSTSRGEGAHVARASSYSPDVTGRSGEKGGTTVTDLAAFAELVPLDHGLRVINTVEGMPRSSVRTTSIPMLTAKHRGCCCGTSSAPPAAHTTTGIPTTRDGGRAASRCAHHASPQLHQPGDVMATSRSGVVGVLHCRRQGFSYAAGVVDIVRVERIHDDAVDTDRTVFGGLVQEVVASAAQCESSCGSRW